MKKDLEESIDSKEVQREMFNRSTLEVAKTIIDDENIATRNKKYLKEESRLCFLSVYTAFNSLFSVVIDLYEDSNTAEEIKTKLEPYYKGIPVGFNLPLETRVAPQIRKMKVAEADNKRESTGAPNKIIVKGYNDPDSLSKWNEGKT